MFIKFPFFSKSAQRLNTAPIVASLDLPIVSVSGNLPVRDVPHLDSILDIQSSVPQFRREYRAKINDRASIIVWARSSWSKYRGHERYKYGQLVQPDGKYILFDPNAIAEKILDPILVPKIQLSVELIFAIDREFISGNPDSFIDESGTVWLKDRRA